MVLEKRGFKFESDTDTESVAILCKYLYDSAQGRKPDFTSLIKSVVKELEALSHSSSNRYTSPVSSLSLVEVRPS